MYTQTHMAIVFANLEIVMASFHLLKDYHFRKDKNILRNQFAQVDTWQQ